MNLKRFLVAALISSGVLLSFVLTFAGEGPVTLRLIGAFDVPALPELRYNAFSAGPTGLAFLMDRYRENIKMKESWVVWTTLKGILQQQVVLPPFPYTSAHIAISRDGALAVARIRERAQFNDIVICSRDGVIVDHYETPLTVRSLRFIGPRLAAMTYEGIFELRTAQHPGVAADLSWPGEVKTEVTSYPFMFFSLPSGGIGVLEYTKAVLWQIRSDRSVTKGVRVSAPEIDEISAEALQDGAAVMYTADADEDGHVFAAVSGYNRRAGLKIIELAQDGSLVKSYRLALDDSRISGAFNAFELRVTGKLLYISSFQHRSDPIQTTKVACYSAKSE